MATLSSIVPKLVAASLAIENGRIPKNGTRADQNYKFATEADVMSRCRPALLAEGIVVLPSYEFVSAVPFQTSGGKTQILTTLRGSFTFTDGESELVVSVIGTGADSSDKGAYKAAAGCRKYAYLQALSLSTGEDDPEIDLPAPVVPELSEATRLQLVSTFRASLELAGLDEAEVVAKAKDSGKGGSLDRWAAGYLVKCLAHAVDLGASRVEAASSAADLVPATTDDADALFGAKEGIE